MIKISVIVPVLNGAAYIKECMESLVNQSLQDIEILVVDAGSTDGTLEILREYAQRERRVRILHSDKKSTGHQCNLGIEAAQGRYVGFCESDDYSAGMMFEELYRLASDNDLDYIKSDFDMFIDKEYRIFLNYHLLAGPRAQLYDRVFRPGDYPDILFRDVNMWNGIYRTNFLREKKIRLNPTPGAAFQDTGFVIQTFLLAERSMYVHREASRYRRDNVTSSVYNMVMWERITVRTFRKISPCGW